MDRGEVRSGPVRPMVLERPSSSHAEHSVRYDTKAASSVHPREGKDAVRRLSVSEQVRLAECEQGSGRDRRDRYNTALDPGWDGGAKQAGFGQ